MPVTAVESYTDPEQLAAAFIGAKVQLVPTGGRPFAARVTKVVLRNLWMHRVYEHVPWIKQVEQTPTRTFVEFLTRPGGTLAVEGSILPYEGIVRQPRGHCYYERSDGDAHWGGVSLPENDLTSAGIAIAGCDLSPPPHSRIVLPPAASILRLRQVHGAVAALAENAPHVLAGPAVAHGLAQALIESIVGCLSAANVREPTWGQQCHTTIMKRFYGVLEENPTRPIYLPEFCAEIRVPERTLRLCCQEHLGMSPKQYLVLRRISLAHRALRDADPGATTVTEIATSFGFWHFGRFANSYRSTFGESPSVTLNRGHN